MIPKIIHYCWLSEDLIPLKLQTCMDSWNKYLTDYELIHWNFERFPKGRSQWVDQAFDNKKYAFAADYIRLYALYHHGGFYLDMDVEVKRSFNPLLKLPIVLCWQKDVGGLEVAAFGVEKHSPIIKECLDRYTNRCFIKNDGEFDQEVLPNIVYNVLLEKGYEFVNVKSIDEATAIVAPFRIPVFSCDYFSPKSYRTEKSEETNNTYCIHHFAGSWKTKYEKIEYRFWKMLGMKDYCIISRILHGLRN